MVDWFNDTAKYIMTEDEEGDGEVLSCFLNTQSCFEHGVQVLIIKKVIHIQASIFHNSYKRVNNRRLCLLRSVLN